MFLAPHGALCGTLLAPVMAANLRALRERHSASFALVRYTGIACVLTDSISATADDGVAWVQALARSLRIPGLTEMGVDATTFGRVASQAASASSMKANPIELTQAELVTVLAQADLGQQ